jgi:hypothetical protein
MAASRAPFRKKVIGNTYRVRFGVPHGRDSVLMTNVAIASGNPQRATDISAQDVIHGNLINAFRAWYEHMKTAPSVEDPFFLHVSGNNLYLRLKRHRTTVLAVNTTVLSVTPSTRAAQINAAHDTLKQLNRLFQVWFEFSKRAK